MMRSRTTTTRETTAGSNGPLEEAVVYIYIHSICKINDALTAYIYSCVDFINGEQNESLNETQIAIEMFQLKEPSQMKDPV